MSVRIAERSVPRGLARVQRMLEQAWVAEIGYIATSEERKAVETAELLADHLALSYVTRADLGENDHSPTGYLAPRAAARLAQLELPVDYRPRGAVDPNRASHA